MLDVQTTYQKLLALDETVTAITNLDWAIKHVANPLYRFNLSTWRKRSFKLAFWAGIIYSVYYEFIQHRGDEKTIVKILDCLIEAIVAIAIFLAVILAFWIVFHFVLFVVKQIRKNNPAVLRKKNEFLSQRQKYLEKALCLQKQLAGSVVPVSLRTLTIVGKLNGYLQSGQAQNLNDAIHYYELEVLQSKIQEQQEQINNLAAQNTQLSNQLRYANRRASRAQTSADLAKFMWLLK